MRELPPEGPELLWAAAGLGQGFTSPVLANDVIYITGMDHETETGSLFALDMSGSLRWKRPYGPEWNGTYPGARSTPTVNEGRVYLMSGFGAVVCLDAGSGAVLWTREAAMDFAGPSPVKGFAEALLVVDEIVICTPGGPGATLAGLDKTTGQTVWQSEELSEMSAYCSPILVERGKTTLAVTIVEKSVVGFRPGSGEILWKLPIDEDEEDQNHSITPVYEDGLLYVTSGHKSGGQMIELSPDGLDAHVKWRDQVLNPGHGGVLFINGHIYGANARGRWICLDAADGKTSYEERGVGRGSLTSADGMLYCYGERGDLALAPVSPKAFTMTGSFEVELGDEQHWRTPLCMKGASTSGTAMS